MASPLPYFQFFVKEWLASTTTRRMTLAARGAMVDLLAFQWEEGGIVDDQTEIAAMLGVAVKEVRAIWAHIERAFPLCEDGQRRNPRCARDREAAHSKSQQLKENGAKGGRPKKPEANQKETKTELPGNQSETNAKPNGFDLVNQTETKTKPIPEPEPNLYASAEALAEAEPSAPLRRNDPFDRVARVLTAVAERLKLPPPTRKEVGKYLGESSPIRLLIEKFGEEETAALYVWVTEHKPLGMSWHTICDQSSSLIPQMRNGVKFVPRQTMQGQNGVRDAIENNPYRKEAANG